MMGSRARRYGVLLAAACLAAMAALPPARAAETPPDVDPLGGPPSDVLPEAAGAQAMEVPRITVEQIVAVLVEALKHDKTIVQLQAIEALRRLGPDAAAACPALEKLLEHEKPIVAKVAVPAALCRIRGDADMLALLVATLNGKDTSLRLAAANGLGSIGPNAKHAVPLLTALLKDTNDRMACVAAPGALYRITGDAPMLAMVIAALRDESRFVRRDAASVLGPIGREGAEAAAPALLAALKDKDPVVRGYAAASLGRIGPVTDDVIPALARTLKDEDSTTIKYACSALGEIGRTDARAFPPLIETLLGHEKYAAMCGLANAGPAAVPPLAVLLKDRDGQKRHFATLALAGIRPVTQAQLDVLVAALAQRRNGTNMSAARALAKIGRPAVPALAGALRAGTETAGIAAAYGLREIGEDAVDAVPALVEALKGRSRLVRDCAAWTLGVIGPAAAEAVPALIETIEGTGRRDTGTRASAAFALGKIGAEAKAAVPALQDLLARGEGIASKVAAPAALHRLMDDKEMVTVMADALVDPDRRVRRAAADALGDLGPAAKSAVPALMKATTDEAREVESAARYALKKILHPPKETDQRPDYGSPKMIEGTINRGR